jgi:U3 small nucleolar RNA-associated protein 24
MGRVKKTRKFAQVKRMIKPTDIRVKAPSKPVEAPKVIEPLNKLIEATKVSSAMFFAANKNLRPPYQVLIDTNFINFSIQNKLDIFKSMMDCLLAKCVPCITDCVIAELEKLGSKYRLALRLAKDPRIVRLTCTHKGNYADDCLVDRVTQHRCYLVGTNDRDLKRRLRKIPGVPLLSVTRGKYLVERIPETITAIPMNKDHGNRK